MKLTALAPYCIGSLMMLALVLAPQFGAFMGLLSSAVFAVYVAKEEERKGEEQCLCIKTGTADAEFLIRLAVSTAVSAIAGALSAYVLIWGLSNGVHTLSTAVLISSVVLYSADKLKPRLRCHPERVCKCSGKVYYDCSGLRVSEDGESVLGPVEIIANEAEG